jgi:hypothetical protein
LKVITISALLVAVVFIGVFPAFQRTIPFIVLTDDFGNPVEDLYQIMGLQVFLISKC